MEKNETKNESHRKKKKKFDRDGEGETWTRNIGKNANQKYFQRNEMKRIAF